MESFIVRTDFSFQLSSLFHILQSSRHDHLLLDIPANRLIPNQEDVSLVWFNPELIDTDVLDSSLSHLRTLNDYVLFYTQKSLYLEYLMSEQKRNDHIIVILHDIEFLDQTNHCEQVDAILLMNMNRHANVINERDHQKVVGIFENTNSMLVKLKQVIADVEHHAAQNVREIFSTFNRRERVLRDVRHELGLFMWRQVFKGKCKKIRNSRLD